MTKIITPVFIAKTRSFWLGIVPAVLTLIDVAFQVFTEAGQEPVAAAISAILHPLTGWTPDQISATMRTMAPLYALIVAHQRRGLSRPYTANPATEAAVERAVEDGKSAFEAGKAIGKAIVSG